jgi:hypothetical protein
MGLITRIKTWVAGDTLTAGDLNAEFDGLVDGLTDGTKNINVSNVTAQAVTTTNTMTFTGTVNASTVLVNINVVPATTATYSLGNTTNTYTAVYLDNGTTDGGAIYFNAANTAFIKSDNSGASLAFNVTNVNISGTLNCNTITNVTVNKVICYQGSAGTTTANVALGTAPYAFVMPRNGSVTAISGFANIASRTASGNVYLSVSKNSGSAYFNTNVVAVTDNVNTTVSETYTIGSKTFAAGDTLALTLHKINSLSCTATAQGLLEVNFN